MENALTTDHMITLKIWAMSVIATYFWSLSLILEPFALHALHLLHWVFRTVQFGSNGATVGTFLLAVFKTIWPNVSVREMIRAIFTFRKRKK